MFASDCDNYVCGIVNEAGRKSVYFPGISTQYLLQGVNANVKHAPKRHMAPASFIICKYSLPLSQRLENSRYSSYITSQKSTPIIPKATADAQLSTTAVHVCRK